jgi:hypothetical protein
MAEQGYANNQNPSVASANGVSTIWSLEADDICVQSPWFLAKSWQARMSF